MMSSTIEALREIISSRNTTQAAVARAAGVSPATVSMWMSGARKPTVAALTRISDTYGVSVDFLLGRDGLRRRSLPSATRSATSALMGRVHAGDGSEPDILDDSVPIPYEVWERHRRGFMLEIEGDCMDRVLPPGCLVLVDPFVRPANGSIAVVSVDESDYLVRRYVRGAGTVMLSPESSNPKWRDVVVTEGDGHVLQLVGTVVWYQAPSELS